MFRDDFSEDVTIKLKFRDSVMVGGKRRSLQAPQKQC